MVRKKQTFIHNDAMVDRPPSEDAEEVNINPKSLFILTLCCCYQLLSTAKYSMQST